MARAYLSSSLTRGAVENVAFKQRFCWAARQSNPAVSARMPQLGSAPAGRFPRDLRRGPADRVTTGKKEGVPGWHALRWFAVKVAYRGASSSGSTEKVCDGPIGVNAISTRVPIDARYTPLGARLAFAPPPPPPRPPNASAAHGCSPPVAAWAPPRPPV